MIVLSHCIICPSHIISHNTAKSDMHKMQKLREAMPSINGVLQMMHATTKTDDKLGKQSVGV